MSSLTAVPRDSHRRSDHPRSLRRATVPLRVLLLCVSCTWSRPSSRHVVSLSPLCIVYVARRRTRTLLNLGNTPGRVAAPASSAVQRSTFTSSIGLPKLIPALACDLCVGACLCLHGLSTCRTTLQPSTHPELTRTVHARACMCANNAANKARVTARCARLAMHAYAREHAENCAVDTQTPCAREPVSRHLSTVT